MVSIWNAFKSLTLWQIAVLTVVLFGAAGATYGGYVRGTSPDLVDLEENQQLIPVKYGDLINEITTNGSLVFPNRETLSFGSPGTVMEILVEEGSPVTAGQVLAKLDATSVASLAQQVAQRELDLNDSTEILEETRAIDPLELAQKKEAVASARFQSKEAIDALEDAREPYTAQEIETQRQLVADTRLDLQSAERALAGLARDHAVQLAQAREVKTNADLTFDVSRQELSDFARDYTQQVALAQQVQASAELALDTARESLDDLPRIHTDDLAQARQDQADAQVALDLAQRGLATYSPDYDLELAEAGEEAALAATALDQAEQALVDFHRDYNTQLGQARLDEPVAQSELKAARDALEAYENANTRWLEQDRAKRIDLNAQLAKINASIDSAINSSNAGLTGLDLRIITLQQSKQFLQEDLADTLESLAAADRLVASVELNVAKLEQTQHDLARRELGPDPIRRRQLKSAVEVARTTLTDTEQELTRLEQGPDPLQRRDLEAAVELAEANLAKTQQVQSGLELGPDSLLRQQLQSDLAVAQADLAEAKDALADVEGQDSPQAVAMQVAEAAASADELEKAKDVLAAGKSSGVSKPELTSAESAVANALISVATAEEVLTAITAGADPSELALREAKLSLAQANRADAQQDLALLIDGPEPLETASKEADVARLTATLTQAEEDLAELLAGADALAVALKSDQVTLAQATLADAEEALAELEAGPDPFQVAVAEAEFLSAQLALKDARQLVDDSSIKAPLDGFVSQISVEDGDTVQANTAILDVVDPSVIEVDGIVDEIDVLSIQLGIRAKVTVDALRGATLEGIVTEISPGASNQQGVVTYPIRIQVQVPQDMTLREGLTAVASIVLREERNVLLVPQQALYGSFDKPVVRVVNGEGVIEERAVELGESDEFWVSVRTGLKDGDQVAMVADDVSTSQFSFRQFRRVTGSSGRGGGGSRGGRR